MNNHKIIFGDSRKMSLINDKSIQLIITSPPYWQLKDYGSENQIGFNDSYENYINNLNLVWKECYRVLDDGCRLCINIGDQFARAVYYGRYKVIPIRTEIIRFCETIGFDYMGAIIWQKNITMNTTGGGAVMGSFPYPRNGILKIDYEFILIFKKLGNNLPKVSKIQKEQSILSKEEWNKYFASHWNFPGTKQDKHIAMFPLELPTRLIKMFSFVGENVLDPFLGSGTTILSANILNRNGLGYEINKNFENIIKDKLKINANDLMSNINTNTYEFLEDHNINFNENLINIELSKLPYLFKDPLQLDKKIDVKSLNFGSKISDNDKNYAEKKSQYFSVKNINSSNNLTLNNGIKIQLIGIKASQDIDNNVNAILYLDNILKGKKVFMKYDSIKYNSDNDLLCYLYLENKTFINTHLLKTGFVDIDDSIEFKYSNKFKEIINNINKNKA